VLTYKMATALRPQICDVTSPYVYRPPSTPRGCGPRHAFNKIKMADGCHFKNQ